MRSDMIVRVRMCVCSVTVYLVVVRACLHAVRMSVASV